MEARKRTALTRKAWSTIADLFFGGDLSDRFRRAAVAAGFSGSSGGGPLKALLALDPDSPSSMRNLADRLRYDASYITGIVDELEAAGHVQRVVSPEDRRIKLIQLCPSGEEACQRAREVLREPPKILERLSDEEIATFASLVAKLT